MREAEWDHKNCPGQKIFKYPFTMNNSSLISIFLMYITQYYIKFHLGHLTNALAY